MTKLPKGALENIEFGGVKQLLKENKGVSGFKDYVREYVGDVLNESGEDKIEREDFEKLEKDTKQISNGLDYNLLTSALKSAFEKAKIKSNYSTRILPALIKTGILDKQSNDFIRSLLIESFETAQTSSTYNEHVIPSLIKSGIFNKDNFKEEFKQELRDLLDQGLKNAKRYPYIAEHLIPVLVSSGLFNKEDFIQDFKALLTHYFNELERNPAYAKKIIPILINTGVLDIEDKEFIKKSLVESFEKAKTNSNYATIVLPTLINTGILDKEEFKKDIMILLTKYFEVAKTSPSTGLVILELINIGVLGKEDIMYIKDLLSQSFEYAKTNSDYTRYIIPHCVTVVSVLINTGVLDRQDFKQDLKDILLQSFEYAKTIPDYARYRIPNLISTGLFNTYDFVQEDLLTKISEYGKTDYNYAKYIIPALANTGILNEKDFKEKLKDLLIQYIGEARKDIHYAKDVVPNLINTGVVNTEEFKQEFKDLLIQYIGEARKDIHYAKDVVPNLINTGVVNTEEFKQEFRVLLTEIFEKAKTDYNYVKDVIPNLINTGVVSIEEFKQELKNLLTQNLEAAKTDRYSAILIPVLINTGVFNLEGFDKDFDQVNFETKNETNLKIYNKILDQTNNNFSLRRYLDSIFLNIEKLEEFEKFTRFNLDRTVLLNSIDDIVSHPEGLYFGYFRESLKNGLDVEDSDITKFPITKSNFLDFMQEDEVLIEFEKDEGVVWKGTKPWTKAWFIEEPERKEYLTPQNIITLKKFGSITGLGIIGSSKNSKYTKQFYEYIFQNISPEKSRSSILQLGEVFNLILKEENYQFFDEILPNSNIGTDFKNFIEENSISNKGRTILTLLITREIRDSFQIWKSPEGDQEIDFSNIETLLKTVLEKLKLYKVEIDKYRDMIIKTSMGMEYEVTRGIANGYEKEIGSNYKDDIETISEYAEVAKGNDAVHEIATSPTDNPMLLILEMKLLEDLDFLDLNFKKEDYAKGSRGLHITLGGEYGITLDNNSNFIQNILIASNLGGINAGEVKSHNVKYYHNISENDKIANKNNDLTISTDLVGNSTKLRQKGIDCEAIFQEDITPTLEYRSLSIIKKEQFERMIISMFNLNMAKQACDMFLDSSAINYTTDNTKNSNDKKLELGDNEFKSIDTFKDFVLKNDGLKEDIKDEKVWILMYEFLKLKHDVVQIIDNHNNNFLENETIDTQKQEILSRLFLILTSTGPIVTIMKKAGVDIHYLITLGEQNFTQEEFETRLTTDGKDLNQLTNNQRSILFGEYKLRIRKELLKIKDADLEIYENIGKYLNGSIDDTMRKITNTKRFKEVIGDDENYLSNLKIPTKSFFTEISPKLVNQFTHINNLFIKKDSPNALAMYDTTLEPSGELVLDRRSAETTTFDKLDMGLVVRKGHNIIQGASNSMITQAIQKRILEFNEKVRNA